MKETYTTYEQAQALKRLGFDWKCNHYWCNGDGGPVLLKTIDENNFNYENWSLPAYSVPTLNIAAKWLRDKKGIFVGVTYDNSPTNEKPFGYVIKIPMCYDRDGSMFDEYEDALSAGITEVLKLFEEK